MVFPETGFSDISQPLSPNKSKNKVVPREQFFRRPA
jgi:hypothetical protein